MARYSGKKKVSEETRSKAAALAKGTQSPGQTKAQTRLIAQGIERGIDLYKKEQKEKARAQDRARRERRAGTQEPGQASAGEPAATGTWLRQAWLPWLLLAVTWAVIVAWWFAGTA